MGQASQIVTIVGARPQFIKAAVVSRELRRAAGDGDGAVRELLVHTGQHFDANMSDVFFEELDIPRPHAHLGIGGGSHGRMTGRMLEAIEAVLLEHRPRWVLVYGDTNSTLAGALAAVKLHVPVAHVEAGLRSFNRRMPEEINRVLTDHASTRLFAPTATAVENLRAEGVDPSRIEQVGDVMYDAMQFYRERALTRSGAGAIMERLGLHGGEFILATIHRAETTDDPARLAGAIDGLRRLAGIMPVVLPLHPRTRNALDGTGRLEELRGALHLIDPVGYLDMVMLESRAALIATDSGGVQKEAYFHGVPCLTLRDETEWVELVEVGANTLVGTDPDAIIDAARTVLGRDVAASGLYGTGDAAARIVSSLDADTATG